MVTGGDVMESLNGTGRHYALCSHEKSGREQLASSLPGCQYHSPPLPSQLCTDYLHHFGEIPRRRESFGKRVEGVDASALISNVLVVSLLQNQYAEKCFLVRFGSEMIFSAFCLSPI